MSETTSLRTGAEALAALQDLPGGPQLVELAASRDDGVELVGGAVRDLLRGETPRELDVVVGTDAAAFAAGLAHRLHALTSQRAEDSPESSFHDRFGTARVWWEGHRIDVATRRCERYPQPGALPEVAPGTPEQDLQRRDFTVNAIALALSGPHRGELRAAPEALADLSAGQLRVLHDNSFSDDPTRLFRLARYRARLHFTIEEHTASLLAAAVHERVLHTVSRARLGAELRLALSEPDIVATLDSLADLGLLRALDAQLDFDELTARQALALLAEARARTRPDLLLLTSLFVRPGYPIHYQGEEQDREHASRLLSELEFLASERDLVVKALADGPDIAYGLIPAQTRSEIHRAAARVSLEAVALIGALGTVFADAESNPLTDAARCWLAELHDVRLRITGEDLLAAGVPQGPEIGRCLEAALRAKLDGELHGEGHEAELKAALEALP